MIDLTPPPDDPPPSLPGALPAEDSPPPAGATPADDEAASETDELDATLAPDDVQRLLDQKVRVSATSAEELAKIGLVYVAPPGYDEAWRALREWNMVHLVGPDHAGKFAMAHALARQCAAGAGLRIRTLRCSEDASILDLLEDPNCPQQSVFIMRDGFLSPGLIRRDFHGNLGALQEILYSNGQFLILTTDGEATAANRIGDGRQTVAVFGPPPDAYPELLDNHFRWYSTPDSWRKPAAGVALGAFTHPYHFDLFAARLQRLDARPTHPQLEVIARDIKDSALSVRVWFAGLNANQRYFAMLACLCPSLTLDELWKLYDKLIEFLKGQGIQLDSPLNYGREDLLESIQALQTDAGTVEFNSPIFAQGALAQAQNNYREQFRLVLPKFVNEIKDTVTSNRPAARDRRLALTTAIGLLGQADLRWVRPQLLDLAQHQELDVRLAAAAALRRICDEEKQRQPVTHLLAGWAKDNRPRVRWTTVASYSKLHLFMGERSLAALGSMAADAHEDVRREVAYSLESLFRRAPDDAIAALNDLLASADVNTGRTVRAATGRIAKNSKVQASYFYDPARQNAFWPLADQVIRRGSAEQAGSALALVRSWLANGRDSSQSEKHEEALLATAGELGQQRHKLLKDAFTQWRDAAPAMSPLHLSASRLCQDMESIYPLLIIDEADLPPIAPEDADAADVIVVDIPPQSPVGQTSVVLDDIELLPEDLFI